MVGVARFELAASWSRTKHSYHLSYTPLFCYHIIIHNFQHLARLFLKFIEYFYFIAIEGQKCYNGFINYILDLLYSFTVYDQTDISK